MSDRHKKAEINSASLNIILQKWWSRSKVKYFIGFGQLKSTIKQRPGPQIEKTASLSYLFLGQYRR
jgi:hypothetical protein